MQQTNLSQSAFLDCLEELYIEFDVMVSKKKALA